MRTVYSALLIGSASITLLVACGGDDKHVISCSPNEFTSLSTELSFLGESPDDASVVVQLIDKQTNRDVSDGRATLACNATHNECSGMISSLNKIAAGSYTLSAKEKSGRALGSVAVEIKANSASACSTDLKASISSITKSYLLDQPLNGTLGEELHALMAPNFWNGEKDGTLMMPSDQVKNLTPGQQSQLRDLIQAGQLVVLTQAQQVHIDTLSQILGVRSPTTLKANQPYVDFYAFGSDPSAHIKGFSMMPVNNGNSVNGGLQTLDIETEQQKLARVQAFIDWLKKPQPSKSAKPDMASHRQTQASSGCGDGCIVIQNQPAAIEWTHQYSVAYNTGTCNSKLPGPCNNNYQVTADIWPVYLADSVNKITDYFIVQLGSNLAPQACYGWYRGHGMDHENRIAAYWAQHYQYQISTLQADGKTPWDYDDLQINSNYQPNTAASSVDVTTGVSWSLSGSGSVSSMGFSSGVTFSNTQKQTYTAMAATSNVASSATNNPSLAQWDYDSKDYVKASVVPSNHACGGSGFNYKAIDSTDVSTTFSPQATFLWQATNDVRTQLASAQKTPTGSVPSLPVNVDLGVLLGWAYWPKANQQCDSPSIQDDGYRLDNTYHAGFNSAIAGMESLIYDVSCGTNTEWGTMPLGPNDHSGGDGNPGSIYMLNSPVINVPFANPAAVPKN